jgi:cytochrome P450
MQAPVPAHVPPELVVDFDYHHVPGAEDDYQLALKALHKGPDIFWTPRNGGHWVFTRADDLAEGFRDHLRFSSETVVVPRIEKPLFRGLPIESDPPEHGLYRSLIQPAFLPRPVAEREAQIRALTISLIEGFQARGECEFMTEFAQHLPITVFLNLVDLPLDDRLTLMEWTGEFLDPPDHEAKEAAAGRLVGYIQGKVAERRAQPGADLLSRILQSQVNGRPVNDAEAISMGILLLFGGLDTVVSMLGFFANFLAGSRPHRQLLIESPDLIPAAVDEMLRRFGLANPGRVIAQDFTHKGVEFRKGEQVLLMSALHGLDERKWDNPLLVDFHRPNAAQHSTFGGGAHRCIGSVLARVELRVFLEEWLKRIPHFQVKPGEKVRMASGVNGSVTYLPLCWEARTH